MDSDITITQGTLTLGNDATARTLTVTGNLTLGASGTLTTNSSAVTHTLLIGANFTHDGVFTTSNGNGRIATTFNSAISWILQLQQLRELLLARHQQDLNLPVPRPGSQHEV